MAEPPGLHWLLTGEFLLAVERADDNGASVTTLVFRVQLPPAPAPPPAPSPGPSHLSRCFWRA